jgi:predicted DNA-binding protein
MNELVITQNGKKVTKMQDKIMAIRLSQELRKAISAEAALQKCSESDFIRSAIEDKLLKDINDNNLIIELLPRIMQEQKRTREMVELSNELFVFWLKYFFSYTPSFPNEETARKQAKVGESSKQEFLERFKKYKQANNKSWLEQLIMEYFEFTSDEGGTIK